MDHNYKKDRSAEIIEMFISRGYFKTQIETIEAALELLLEKQLVEDSYQQAKESETPEWIQKVQFPIIKD